MKVIIQTPDFKPSPELFDFVAKEVEKIGHLSDRIIEARVCIKFDRSDSQENKVCEIIGVIPGKDLFVKREAHTFEKATTDAVNAMKRQITDWKEKREEH